LSGEEWYPPLIGGCQWVPSNAQVLSDCLERLWDHIANSRVELAKLWHPLGRKKLPKSPLNEDWIQVEVLLPILHALGWEWDEIIPGNRSKGWDITCCPPSGRLAIEAKADGIPVGQKQLKEKRDKEEQKKTPPCTSPNPCFGITNGSAWTVQLGGTTGPMFSFTIDDVEAPHHLAALARDVINGSMTAADWLERPWVAPQWTPWPLTEFTKQVLDMLVSELDIGDANASFARRRTPTVFGLLDASGEKRYLVIQMWALDRRIGFFTPDPSPRSPYKQGDYLGTFRWHQSPFELMDELRAWVPCLRNRLRAV